MAFVSHTFQIVLWLLKSFYQLLPFSSALGAAFTNNCALLLVATFAFLIRCYFCINNFPMLPASTTSRCYPHLHQQTAHYYPHNKLPFFLYLSLFFRLSLIREFESSRVQPPNTEQQPTRCYPHLHQQSSTYYFPYPNYSTAVLFHFLWYLDLTAIKRYGEAINGDIPYTITDQLNPLLQLQDHWHYHITPLSSMHLVCDTAIFSQYPPTSYNDKDHLRNYNFPSSFLVTILTLFKHLSHFPLLTFVIDS